MTIKQALEYAKHELKHYKQVERDGIRMVDHIEFYEIVVDALIKQTPLSANETTLKIVINDETIGKIYSCPVCANEVNESNDFYCSSCGQKLKDAR